MFNSSSARFARLITLAVAVLVLLPGMALGDNLQSDLNTSTGGQQKTVARGTLSPSTAYTQPVLLWVDETSGTTNNPSYPFNVTLDSATLNGNAFAGASFSGVQITAAGEANGKSGDAGWTTPAAQPTSQDYSLVVSFLANTTINESPSTITITFTIAAAPSDSTPPNTTIVTAPDATTSSTSASFTYSSNESGSTFACKLDAGSFASCPAAGKSYSGLGEGSHTFAVRATDGAGNTDPTPATYDWTIDLTPPAVSAPDLTAASDSGSSQVDDVTNDATPSFTGTAEDGASVELLRDGSPVDSTTATGGTWSFTSAALTDGTYGFAARATDAAGNVATSSALDVVVDVTDPTIVEASRLPVANADGWNNAAVTVIWDCADALSGATADSDSDTVSGEGAGQTADGSCSDVAGNSASASRDGINIDTTAPSASASATANGSPYTAGTWTKYDVVVTFGCTDALSGVGSVTDPATLGEGADQSASGTCTDKAGNSAGASFDDIDVDKTAPVASASAKTADDVTYAGGSWTNQSVTVTFDCTDALSGVASLTPPSSTLGDDGADQLASSDCVDNAGNSANASFGDIDIDKTVPVIAFVSRLPAANPAGWNNGAVTVTWNCTDGLSGPVSGSVSDTRSGEGAGQTANGICEDLAGNSAGDSVGDITIDLTDPYGISWLGGPLTGSSYYFGSVPAAPTCSAFDDLSGLASCGVTGYSAAVGSHTMTATALDVAGNDAMAQRSYNVLAWTLRGFYQPVDMNGVWNTVKNGSTVPLKWEMFAGTTELTDTSLVALDAKQLSCSGGIGEDAVELTATGATSLRYDETGGQFIYNWQTPKKPGTCYRVTMTADDGSTLSALFKLK